jgi:tyrosine decarboxylase/aspartate 1-decarboxylase
LRRKLDLESKGAPQREILEMLEKKLKDDFVYDSGRIIGSMCTRPHPLSKKVYLRYLDKNLGDSRLFPATTKLELEAVQMIGAMLSNSKASGQIVTGGTEANLLALWAARKATNKNHCEVIVPSSAHYSFDKAADLLGLKIVRVKLNEQHQVDTKAVRNAISPHTIALVGIAGTTELGVVDPIVELSEIASERDLYLHVDAAFGGFVLPFLKKLNYVVPDFDFTLPAVCSMTVDPHKMGLAPIPAGGIMYRDERLKEKVRWRIPYLSGGETTQNTIVGTRSGASVIAVWALMKYFGEKGYTRIVRRCMNLTLKLAEEIPKIRGLDKVTEPIMNIIGIKSEGPIIRRLAQELRIRKWAISLFPNHIRIVIMPHVQEQHIIQFLQDLNTIVDKLRK